LAGGGLASVFGVLGPEAGDIEFQQDRVMHKAIDRRGGRHLIAEDPIPVREDQIASDEAGSASMSPWRRCGIIAACGRARPTNCGGRPNNFG
jgi:hypothetical protein